jgi:glycine/D-amino acid oxidase-like deaminating enzyme
MNHLIQIQEKVAVIGSGIAGCLAALELARAGYEVRIFEELDTAFGGTSATALQAHLGGLYSGNMDTAKECLRSAIEIKKFIPYALNDRNAMFFVAKQSDITLDEYVSFYTELRDYYASLPIGDRVFGGVDDFFHVISAQDHPFIKNVEGGIMTKEPGLDMQQARYTLLAKLQGYGVGVHASTEVIAAEKRGEADFILSLRSKGNTSEYRCNQVINAGGYKCRTLDYQFGDRTSYNLSLEAKCMVRDTTPGEPMPAFYVVRGYFMHMTPVNDGSISCLNTATTEGGYINTLTLDDTTTHIPKEWQDIMTTGIIPDAKNRQRTMIEYANDTFLVGRRLEPVALIPGISTSFSASRQNRTQHKVNIVIPGWQTIVPTKATHALELARQAVENAIAHSVNIGHRSVND